MDPVSSCIQLPTQSTCFDPNGAFHTKIWGILLIFATGSFGVSIPLLGRDLRLLKAESNFVCVTKAFAGGVILATGFVHILPEAARTLSDPCLPKWPWTYFPFAGFIAMLAALGTLLTETIGTDFYESQHSHGHGHGKGEYVENFGSTDSVTDYEPLLKKSAPSSHCSEVPHVAEVNPHNHLIVLPEDHPHHHHLDEEAYHTSHQIIDSSDGIPHDHLSEARIRDIVISQVLEVAVIAHSFIIGLSLGVSESPCAVRPLLAALSFHQFFEGFALGGCIAQAGFENLSAGLRAGLFSVTTPIGILIGIGISSIYQANTPRALLVNGFFDSASAGILIYTSLVDLIATDFQSHRLRGNLQLKVMSYLALFGGSVSMSSLAFWV